MTNCYLMKKLFSNEKKQTRAFNEKLKESLSKMAISEQNLKRQRDNLQIALREKTKKIGTSRKTFCNWRINSKIGT